MKNFILSLLFVFAILFVYGQEIYSVNGNLIKEGAIHFESIGIMNTDQEVFNANNDFTSFKNGVRNTALDVPNSRLMAAMAYDENTNKIIFMPMLSSYVYFQDINSGRLTSVDGSNQFICEACNQGSQNSRMTMAPDGNAYALSNDFTQLIQINPKTSEVNNLGAVKLAGYDATQDKTTWGGDMIADSQNNLYIISAYGKIFKLDLDAKNAVELGEIQGLPEKYTSNGAAVLSDGSIIVANAQGKASYHFTLDDLKASKYQDQSKPIYDLASQFFVPVSEELAKPKAGENIQIYPTIISQKEINLLSDKDLGKVTVKVFDLNSTLVEQFSSQSLNSDIHNTYNLSNLRPNIYIIKAFDASGHEVLNQKVTVVN